MTTTIQATGGYNPDDGYSIGFVLDPKSEQLISLSGLSKEDIIYLRDLFDCLLDYDD